MGSFVNKTLTDLRSHLHFLNVRNFPYTTFFEGMESQRTTFMNCAQQRTAAKNDVLFLEGDESNACFYLASGLVRIFNGTATGKEALLRIYSPGSLFGIAELKDGLPHPVTAQTLTPATLHVLPGEGYAALLQNDPAFSARILRVISKEHYYLTKRVSSLILCDVMEKLLNILVHLYCEALPPDAGRGDLPAISLQISQDQLAAMIGSTQPTISRLLQQLREEGIVCFSRMHISIVAPAVLLRKVSCPL